MCYDNSAGGSSTKMDNLRIRPPSPDNRFSLGSDVRVYVVEPDNESLITLPPDVGGAVEESALLSV